VLLEVEIVVTPAAILVVILEVGIAAILVVTPAAILVVIPAGIIVVILVVP